MATATTAAPAADASTTAATSTATAITPAQVKSFVGLHGGVDNAKLAALLQLHGAFSRFVDLLESEKPSGRGGASSGTTSPTAASGPGGAAAPLVPGQHVSASQEHVAGQPSAASPAAAGAAAAKSQS